MFADYFVSRAVNAARMNPENRGCGANDAPARCHPGVLDVYETDATLPDGAVRVVLHVVGFVCAVAIERAANTNHTDRAVDGREQAAAEGDGEGVNVPSRIRLHQHIAARADHAVAVDGGVYLIRDAGDVHRHADADCAARDAADVTGDARRIGRGDGHVLDGRSVGWILVHLRMA